ncbi:MAG: carbohydrate-binding domain-containing protein [Prevotella sp.]|nr:carbohydrate-binding domain-containing protein [Prevotella sp.]
MKKYLGFFAAIIALSMICIACSSDDDLSSESVIPSGGDSDGGSSVTPSTNSELLSFSIAIDKTTAEPSSTASALYPESGDAPSANSFGTTVNIDMSNPTDPGVTGVTVTVDGNNVVTDHGDIEGVCYVVTGTTSNGSLQINGNTKFKLQLNNATITNQTTTAIDLESKQSAYVELVGTNKVTDGTTEDHKGAIFSKGKLFISGTGSLDVYGTYKNGIHGKSNVVIERGVNLYVKSTANNGIKGGDDIYINGGIINVEVSADAGKAINGDASVYINGGRTTTIATGNGTWEEDETLTYGGDTKAAAGVGCDDTFYMNDGELYAKATGSGGKGVKADVAAEITGGKIRIITTGGLYYSNGTTESHNYNGNTDNLPNAYTSSPKGMKIGTKDDEGNTSGEMTITGGDIMVRTSGTNAEGIESKGTLNIIGGTVMIYAYDDGINSTSDLTINGGTVMTASKTNDGIDSNGNLIIQSGTLVAIGGGGAEAGIDCDESHYMSIQGGTVFGIGGRVDVKFNYCSQAFAVTSGSASANATIKVMNGSTTLGTTAMGPVSYNNGTILVSAPGMSSGKSYTLNIGSNSTTISGVTSYSGGGMGGGGMGPGGGGMGPR